MTAPVEPTMIIVGGDALALGTAREICLIPGNRVVVLWHDEPEFAAAVEAIGARFIADRPESSAGLEGAVSFTPPTAPSARPAGRQR